MRKRCWGKHSIWVLATVDSQTCDALHSYPEKKKATKHWRSHVIIVDLRGDSSWQSQMVLLSQHFTIITMEGQEFHLTIPVHVHEMVYCMQCPHRILLVILRAVLTLASDFRSWMIWFSQSESMGDAQCFLWHYFLQAASNKGTLGFRCWMPTRHGWPVYTKHPKFSKLQADSQEALEHFGTMRLGHVSKSLFLHWMLPFWDKKLLNDHHFHGFTTNCHAFHRDTSRSRDSRPILSEGGGEFLP